ETSTTLSSDLTESTSSKTSPTDAVCAAMRATTCAFCCRYSRIFSCWRRIATVSTARVTKKRIAAAVSTRRFLRPMWVHRLFIWGPTIPQGCSVRIVRALDEQVFRALLEYFYLESKERLDRIEQVLLTIEAADAERRRDLLVEAKRELHTLKGNSAMMGLGELQGLAHRIEDQVAALSPSTIAAA